MFYQPIQPPQPDPEKARREREQEVRRHYQSKMTAFIIPALQSSFTGLLAGLLAGSLLWAVELGNPLKAGFITGVIVWAVVWVGLVANWARLVWKLETALHADLSGDGKIGKPVKDLLKVELKRGDGDTPQQRQYIDIPIDRERLADFARGVLAGQPLSEKAWSGAGALFSQNEYKALRDTLISKGLARWRDESAPKLGYEVTAPGRAFLRAVAAPSPTPQPADPENWTR